MGGNSALKKKSVAKLIEIKEGFGEHEILVQKYINLGINIFRVNTTKTSILVILFWNFTTF